MAGLLDTNTDGGGGLLGSLFSDPGARLGLGLLAASSPRLQGLGQVMAQQDQANLQALQQQLMQSQIAENAAQAKMREQQFGLAQQKQNMLAGLFGGAAPLAGVTTGGGLNMSSGGGSPSGGGLANLTIDQVAALKANGIDVYDAWKLQKEGFKREAGSYNEDLYGNSRYFPKLDNGMAIANGQVMAAPGYANANAGIKGAEAGAVEAAKYPYAVGQDAARQNLGARLDPTKIYNPQTGREEFVPRATVAQPQFTGAGYAGGSASAAAPEQIRIMQSELARMPANSPDRAAVSREIARLQGFVPRESGNYAAGPSAQEAATNDANRERMVGTAKADVARDSDSRSKVRSATENLTNADRAIELLNLGPTGSSAGALVDRGAAFFGKSTPGGNVAAQLDIVSANMVKNVPRFEGPQSNIDVDGYKAAAGRVADRTLPIEQRIAAANEVKYFEQKAIRQNQGGQGGGASGSWNGSNQAEQQKPASAQREFSMLPNANQYNGKRMQAPDGTIYRSSGGRWNKE